ncbi:MAG: EamA family transporter [Pseudonocardiaceae bacterium]|nr:EamA family transporter [Pseudonocardiaceae bacterium]
MRLRDGAGAGGRSGRAGDRAGCAATGWLGAGAVTAALPRTPVAVLVLGSVVGVQFGQAFGKQLLGVAGPMGVVLLRLGFAATVLLALVRPRLPVSRRDVPLILGFGTAIAGMSLFLFPALQRLPVGMTVSLQFLGPLSLALLGSRRLPDLLWAGLAGVGVFLFYDPASGSWSTSGALFALASGACWAVYLLASRRAGTRVGASVLALAVCWAAVVCLPFGILESRTAVVPEILPEILVAGLGLALVSAVLPYSFDLLALRRIPPRVLGVLVSLEPVFGGLGGLLIVGEHLELSQWIAIGLISTASLGVACWRGERPAS